jgi:hypothetical protein
MSHASVGDSFVPSISQVYQPLNNILMINCFPVTSVSAHQSVIRMDI